MLVEVGARLATWAATGPLADLPPPDHDPAQARDAADRILSRPEYRWSSDRGLAERLAEWLSDQLGRISPFGGGGLPVVFGWLLLLALAGAVTYLIVRAAGGWRRPGRLSTSAAGARVVLSEADRHVDWEAEAERCEREGLWADAVRARYRVLVGVLARRGVLGDLVGRTAGELAAEVRANAPAASAPFVAATEVFESAWYGGSPMGPGDVARLRALADAVLAAAGRGPTGPGGGLDPGSRAAIAPVPRS